MQGVAHLVSNRRGRIIVNVHDVFAECPLNHFVERWLVGGTCEAKIGECQSGVRLRNRICTDRQVLAESMIRKHPTRCRIRQHVRRATLQDIRAVSAG